MRKRILKHKLLLMVLLLLLLLLFVVDVSAVVFAVIDVGVSAACNLCVCVLHDDSGCEARRTP